MLHALAIAAIFIPYIVIMAGLSAYIVCTGRHRDRDDGQGEK